MAAAIPQTCPLFLKGGGSQTVATLCSLFRFVEWPLKDDPLGPSPAEKFFSLGGSYSALALILALHNPSKSP